MDNLRVHHSKTVKAWLADRASQIEVFYLPSYSQELNPEERLNAYLKQAMGSGCRSEPKQSCAMLPTSTWRCWRQPSD